MRHICASRSPLFPIHLELLRTMQGRTRSAWRTSSPLSVSILSISIRRRDTGLHIMPRISVTRLSTERKSGKSSMNTGLSLFLKTGGRFRFSRHLRRRTRQQSLAGMVSGVSHIAMMRQERLRLSISGIPRIQSFPGVLTGR